ncbi:collagenase [Paucibacter sp. APW11]|uniref:microbial collagenase n=1 Tax=Roseateles aquae TaxID=3077235 RepID=A0ABU3PD66_9BURK|nr:collagenase [Paucibacter sp. APW11]MDT9000464.1 collagenase [Paucibacter sp. APW11]
MSFCLSLAHASPTASGPMPQSKDASLLHVDHQKDKAQKQDAKDRPPVSAERSQPKSASSVRAKLSARQQLAAAACDTTVFTTRSGSALAEAVRTSTVECVNALFSLRGTDAQRAFNETQMRSVADGLRSYAGSYNGTNSSGVLQLILFLRAGYYVQFNDAGSVGSYGTALKTSIRAALDALYANANIFQVSDANGDVLSEAVTLIDSSTENARYAWVVKRLLDSYSSSWNSSYNMKAAVNSTFTVLWRGHQNADFQALVKSDVTLQYAVNDFTNRNWGLIGTPESYLVSNAARELSRFLQYPTLLSTTRPQIQALMSRGGLNTPSQAIWIGLADMTDYYDPGQCSTYSSCNWKPRAEAAVLPLKQVCSPSLTLRAQAMSAAELNATCSSVINEESYFHNKLGTNRTPVAGDNNSSLELVIFDSSYDYQDYAGPLFGIDTNNGGMYIEGDPTQAGNVPRFYAYEAEWVKPTFEVWNLNHEYTHYLDGRFDMYGDFSAGISTPQIWWIEGLAEHVSYCYRNVTYTDALNEAKTKRYALSTLFDTTYDNADQTRIYNWGFLAVSFMMDKHPTDLQTLLGYYRKGDWTGARNLEKSTIGSRYDSEFNSWLTTVPTSNVNCNAKVPPSGGSSAQAPSAAFKTSIAGLTVNFSDASTDPNGNSTITSRLWSFGDGTTSTATNPSKTYAKAGSYSVTLKVTDNTNLSNTSAPQTVTVSGTPPVNQAPTSNFSYSPSGLTVNFTDRSTDADGTIASRLWTFGDGTTSTATNPVKTYSSAGNYSVTLKVTDNGGLSTTSAAQTVSVASVPPSTCPSRSDSMANGCVRSGLAGAAGDLLYYFIYVDKPNVQLTISTSGGSGNADLYVNTQGWATPTAHNYRSTNSGNAESVVVPVYTPGYVYLTVSGKTAFNGLSLSTRY